MFDFIWFLCLLLSLSTLLSCLSGCWRNMKVYTICTSIFSSPHFHQLCLSLSLSFYLQPLLSLLYERMHKFESHWTVGRRETRLNHCHRWKKKCICIQRWEKVHLSWFCIIITLLYWLWEKGEVSLRWTPNLEKTCLSVVNRRIYLVYLWSLVVCHLFWGQSSFSIRCWLSFVELKTSCFIWKWKTR